MKSFIIAFSMYSKIPMPPVDWDDDGMSRALCFLPAVGAAVGGIMWLAALLLERISAGSLLFGCVMTAAPVIVTGGIHLDGFIDAMDGICSYADREKRLKILNDPHIGAFGLIGALVYFTLSVGIWSEAGTAAFPIVFLGCILSRSLAGWSITAFKKAKSDGLAAEFGSRAHRLCGAALIAAAAACIVGMIAADRVRGGAAAASALLCLLYHYYNCRVNFGGITGDLAGFFIQLCELSITAAAALIN